MLALDLIIPPIVAGLVILAIHAYLGLHVIARGVIFVDLAFAQIAALGTTVGILLGIGHGPGELLFALGFTLLGALIFSFTRMEDSAVPQEAIIGITFVVASAAVILIAGLTAEGAEHIRETMTGTLIWVDWPTIGKMAAAYAVVGGFHFRVPQALSLAHVRSRGHGRAEVVGLPLLCVVWCGHCVFRQRRGRSDGVQCPRHPRSRGVPVHEPVRERVAHCVGSRRGCHRGRNRGILLLGSGDRTTACVCVRGACGRRGGTAAWCWASGRTRRLW